MKDSIIPDDARLRSFCAFLTVALVVVSACKDRSVGNPDIDGGQDSGLACGNGLLDAEEECDGNDLGATTCEDLGFDSGTLSCTSDCTFNRRGCVGGCGNDLLEPPEECDGADLAGQTCNTLTGHHDGALSCNADCSQFDISDCHTCGNGTIESSEECDDGDTGNGDGCSSICRIEEHWQCSGEPSLCECIDFYHGDNCQLCTVFVNNDPSIPLRDGKSWASAFAAIQDGIDQAFSLADSCEVWVAQGIYYIYESSPSDTVLLRSGVGLYGGFAGSETSREQRDWQANQTVLNGTQAGYPPNHVYHVVTATNVQDAVIDGLVIREGQALAGEPDDRGGGLKSDNSSLTLANCTLANNGATGQGGGIYSGNSSLAVIDSLLQGNWALEGGGMYNSPGSTVTVTGSVFLDNQGSGMHNDNCSLTVSDCDFQGNSGQANGGGGIYNYQSSPMVSGCLFDTNSGGGMYNLESSPTVTDCTFTGNNNMFGGGMSNYQSSPAVTDCTFTGNNANFGGGMHNEQSSPTVTDCIFTDNLAEYEGGGMENHNQSSPRLTNCVFAGNSTTGVGGGMSNSTSSSPALINCVFAGNVAGGSAGAMDNVSFSSPTLTNCTFYGNEAGSLGGGLQNSGGSSPIVTNCVFWGNVPDAFYNDSNSSPYVTYSEVEGGYPGAGNIDANPMFVDPGNGDFQVQPGSPCIDSGDGNLAPATDMAGFPRCDDPGTANNGAGTPPYVDMGAYEYQAAGCP
ncbi:MAG: right-handed parallel beta-helix repeat-containing protein [bacterium]